MAKKVLMKDTINPKVITMEYAVRGPIVIRAVELEKELQQGAKKNFANVIKANIGDAHAMGQRPITFIRQIMALVSEPGLIDKADYPQDVKQKAKELLSACGGSSIGAYSQSNGIELIRKHAARYIQERDGIAADPETIVLSGGASEGIRNLLKLFIKHDGGKTKPNGVMIPIPQYPLYSASTEEFGLYQIGYFLDEDNNWGLSIAELERALEESRQHCDPKVICVINPGNPTGQVLSKENIQDIIKFAHKHNLFVFADEVYQDNVYAPGCAFHSFKKVMSELGDPYNKIEMASFMSTSKGYMGECGQRGGFSEILNLDPEVFVLYKKMISAKLCSTVMGQIVLDTVVNHPKQGEPSYDLWIKEKNDVLASLKERANAIDQTFNSIPGIKCNTVQGAMYAFPQIMIPEKAINKAKELKQQPDFFYAMSLLEDTGICVVPGSGFGQRPNTYHFRTTILPQPALMKDMLGRFAVWHEKFIKDWS